MLRGYVGIMGLLLVCCAATSLGQLSSYGTCQTPHKESGLCLHVDDCQYLYTMLLSTDLTATDRLYLQQSQCGYDNTQTTIARRVLVCCPDKHCKDPVTVTAEPIAASNLLPTAGVCGLAFSDRIYGGSDTKIDEFPWMALIRYKKSNELSDFHCGASLINNRYILTAAHCVSNTEVPLNWEVHSVRLGEWDLESDPDCAVDIRGEKDCAPAHLDVRVERVIVHDGYVSSSRDQFNDIALLRLAQPVSFSDFIKPICLPASAEMRSNNFQDTVMDVAGWGLTENGTTSVRKQKITVDVWKVSQCQDPYRSFQINLNGSQQLCAGGKAGVDTCRGDSGGPLMLREQLGNREIFFVVGVVSYGPRPCGLRGWPGVYTRIGSFVDWIQSQLQP